MTKHKKEQSSAKAHARAKRISGRDEAPHAGQPLIRFDRKTLVFLGLLLGVYVIASSLKLHTSSIGLWDTMFGKDPSPSVLWGKPRPIRQDEWMVQTPGLVAQVQSGMQVGNETFGAGNIPLLSGYPVRDITMLIKPTLWPYFFLDLEHAFAFSWNLNIFLFIASIFLVFMVLTGSSFWISAAGAIFLFGSGAMQWWSYALGVGMTWLNIALISGLYMLYAARPRDQYLAAGGFVVGTFNFAAGLYPPWSVPLGYLYLAVFIGLLLRHWDPQRWQLYLRYRVVAASAALAVLAAFVWHHLSLLRDTYAMMLDTAYPGQRVATGGDLISGKFFSEFFGLFMADSHTPSAWLNICEASGVILFFPVILFGIVRRFAVERKADPLLISLAACLLLIGGWVLFGFPDVIARLTFLSMSPAYRTLPVFGVANVFLLVAWLGSVPKEIPGRRAWIEAALLAAAILIFLRITAAQINAATEQFFTAKEVDQMTALFLALYLMIRYAGVRYVMPALLGLLTLVNLPNLRIHPVTKGLDPLLENPLVKIAGDIAATAPDARWCVFGNQRLASLLKASGSNVFNGVKVVPLLDDMAVLDPSGRDVDVYNRYAHINMAPFIAGQDSVVFRLNENNVVNDNYTIFMDPCSSRLVDLGVTHFLFTYEPKPEEIRCMNRVSQYGTLFIYKRN